MTVTIMLAGYLQIHGQDSLSLEQRVHLLEVYNEKILKEDFVTQTDKLSSLIQIELEKAKGEVTDQMRIIEIAGGSISLILAAGLGVVLFQYFTGLRKMADNVLKERLKVHLEENSAFLLDLITSQKVETQIRKSRKVYVVSGNEQDLTQSIKLFRDMKFNEVTGRVYRYYEKLPAADLIVFSARDGSLSDELVIEFLEKGTTEESYVYFSSGQLKYDRSAAYAERLNFANSQYTLYHQIINVLSFKDVMSATNQ